MKTLAEQLELAVELAVHFHKGQVDKGGEPYILHPLRLITRTDNKKEQIVAALHDIIEDTHLTLNELSLLGFDNEVVTAIDCLTRRKNENYDQFIERISENKLATKVKILDLEDNLDTNRLKEITQKDIERIQKYAEARIKLMNMSRAIAFNSDSIYRKYYFFMQDWIAYQESLSKNKI